MLLAGKLEPALRVRLNQYVWYGRTEKYRSRAASRIESDSSINRLLPGPSGLIAIAASISLSLNANTIPLSRFASFSGTSSRKRR